MFKAYAVLRHSGNKWEFLNEWRHETKGVAEAHKNGWKFQLFGEDKKKAELKRTQKIKPIKDVMKDVNCFVKNILYP